jgi:hypothetical protein
LDNRNLDEMRQPILSAIVKLSGKSGLYPECLDLSDVEILGTDAVAGGAFGDIWKGKINGRAVAIKVMRVFGSDANQLLKVLT